jgi:parallel beta-helix repeat protein
MSNVESQKNINSCTSIDKPGHYELRSDITNGGGTGISKSCIKIRSGNVVLDGNGHTISGRGNSHTTGVQVITSKGAGGVKIRNVSLTDWHNGVEFRQAKAANIQNVRASSNVFGISVESVSQAQIKRNTARNNTVGIRVDEGIKQLEIGQNSFSDNEVDLL